MSTSQVEGDRVLASTLQAMSAFQQLSREWGVPLRVVLSRLTFAIIFLASDSLADIMRLACKALALSISHASKESLEALNAKAMALSKQGTDERDRPGRSEDLQ